MIDNITSYCTDFFAIIMHTFYLVNLKYSDLLDPQSCYSQILIFKVELQATFWLDLNFKIKSDPGYLEKDFVDEVNQQLSKSKTI